MVDSLIEAKTSRSFKRKCSFIFSFFFYFSSLLAPSFEQMRTLEEELYIAAGEGDVEEVVSLLRNNPGLDVNSTHEMYHHTALHNAALCDHGQMVKVLLAHPHISVNLVTAHGFTAFSYACLNGNMPLVRTMLKDPRVDVKIKDSNGRTPLWFASFNGSTEVVEWLIASGRDLGDIDNEKAGYRGKLFTVLEMARENSHAEVVSLLERFKVNPESTRHELRVGLLDEQAAEVFALAVFLCDDPFQLKQVLASTSNPAAAGALHFFAIASKLPIELQMILCHRAVGSMTQNILSKDSEAAFKSLARALLSSHTK